MKQYESYCNLQSKQFGYTEGTETKSPRSRVDSGEKKDICKTGGNNVTFATTDGFVGREVDSIFLINIKISPENEWERGAVRQDKTKVLEQPPGEMWR